MEQKVFREQLVHYREWERNRKLMEDFHQKVLNRADYILIEEAPISIGKYYLSVYLYCSKSILIV